MSLRFYSLYSPSSYTGSENQQTEPLSISYTMYRLTLVSFFILSVWAPFIFSYMPHQSFPIFSGFLFHLPLDSCFIFHSPPAVTYFSVSVSHSPCNLLYPLSSRLLVQLRSLSPVELLFLRWYDLMPFFSFSHHTFSHPAPIPPAEGPQTVNVKPKEMRDWHFFFLMRV